MVNPIAGMGGRVGLKGTDGVDMLEEAIRRGAEPVTPERALRFLEALGPSAARIHWLTCSGPMGAGILEDAGVGGDRCEVVHIPGDDTSPGDTREACARFLGRGADAIVFCGGDGTARDVHAAVGDACPVLGVPAGVKMFSGVFALSPEAAAEVLRAFLDGRAEEGDGEVADVDEDAYRRGELAVRLHGHLRMLRVPALIQSMKHVTVIPREAHMQEDIARYVLELLEEEGGPLVILGAGTTVEAVARLMGVEKTPLGVDVVRDGEVLATDASEEELLGVLAEGTKARIVVSPIGAQGFVLGRGSQQISPEVIEAAGGPAALMVVATPHKLAALDRLIVDTGDPELDRRLSGMRRVLVGYHDVTMVRIEVVS